MIESKLTTSGIFFSAPAKSRWFSVWKRGFPWYKKRTLNGYGLSARIFLAKLSIEKSEKLSGLLNRRALTDQAMSGLARAKRKQQPFALAMVDIDHFKSVNDTYGHAAGDQVLSQLAARLTAAVRASDNVGRWGGEEFLVLLPESNREQALVAAERLRTLIEAAPMRVEGDIQVKVTVSIGVGLSRDPHASAIVLDTIIRTADDALYQAKAAGRNRVVVAAT